MNKASGHWIPILMACLALYSPFVSAQDLGEYEAEPFTDAELDSILAPIALYPDSVLSHVLIASTYPLEVIRAARWSRDNPGFDGELAVAAVEDFDWDPSVKALAAFPELLARMDEDIEWTQQIGDAFLIQEASVIATIQGLRDRAYAQGHLKTDEHVRVVREERVIYIEPARTRYVYLPYYDPLVVYGRWWWDAYPPYRWRHPRYVAGISFYWGSGFRIAPTFYFSSFHWSRKRVVVVNHHHYPREHFRSGRDVARYHRADHWRHDPHHRRGVHYRHRVAENRFVEHRAKQTRRAGARQRSVADQRRWASSRRDQLDLHASPQRQGRAIASRSRSAGSDRRSLRGRHGESTARMSRSARQATNDRQQRRVRQITQRPGPSASARDDARTGREAARRSSSATRSINRSGQAVPGRTSARNRPGPSPSVATRRTPRSFDAERATRRPSTSRRVGRVAAPQSSSPPRQRAPTRSSRPQAVRPSGEQRSRSPQRRVSEPRRQSAPSRETRRAPPRSSRDSRARVQSRARSGRGERQRRN